MHQARSLAMTNTHSTPQEMIYKSVSTPLQTPLLHVHIPVVPTDKLSLGTKYQITAQSYPLFPLPMRKEAGAEMQSRHRCLCPTDIIYVGANNSTKDLTHEVRFMITTRLVTWREIQGDGLLCTKKACYPLPKPVVWQLPRTVTHLIREDNRKGKQTCICWNKIIMLCRENSVDPPT